VPDAAAQAKAEELIRQVLADEYARAKADPAARARLVQTLREQGRETRDDPAARFVLFREARDLAASSGDFTTALQVVGELAERYAIDLPAMRLDTLVRAAPAVKGPAAGRDLAQIAVELLDELVEAERHELALKLLPAAKAAAETAADKLLAGEVARRAEALPLLHKEFERLRPLVKKLKARPDHPKANLELGTYHALLRGQWAKGLPLLARGADAGLKKLASLDLAGPQEAARQLELADGWRDQAQKRSGLAQVHLLLRAAHWYQQAAQQLPAPERARAEEQLKAIAARLPAGYRLTGLYAAVRRLEGHRGSVTCVLFARDGQRLLTASGDGTIRLWDAASGQERKRIEGHGNWVRSVVLSADGRRLLSGGDDGKVRLWDLASGREQRRFDGHTEWVRAVAFLPDGKRAVSASDDHTLRLWDVESGKELRRFTGHAGYVLSLALSRDGRRLLSCGDDRTVRLWDVESGKELRRLDGHGGNVNAVAFAPDDRRAASASSDGTVRLWDVSSGAELKRMKGHKGSVWCVTFSPDGRQVLSGGADGTARLWDAAGGGELRRLTGHGALVLAVAFAPDGRQLLTGSGDKTAWLWGELAR
jgi:hypothetical protein